MARMMRRLIALVMVLTMCTTMPLTALAEESAPPKAKEDLNLGTPESVVTTPNSDGSTTTVTITPVTGSVNDTENSTTTGTLTETTTVDDAGNTLEDSWEASGVITTTEQKDKITTEITAEVPLTPPEEGTDPEEGDGLVNHTEVTSDKVDIPSDEEGVTITDNGDTLIVDSSVPEVGSASDVDGDPYISQEEIDLTPLQPEWTGKEEDTKMHYGSPFPPDGEKPEGYDLYYYYYGEDSNFGVAQLDENQEVYDKADVLQFVLNEPRTMLDEDGNPVQDTNPDGTPKVDENGNPVYKQENVKHTAYCVDLSTGTQQGWWYRIESLEDADYYTEEDAAHIRAIVTNGYWGTEPTETDPAPTGSLAALKKALKDAGQEVTGLTDADIDAITEGMASTATQMAIWTYGNQIKREFDLAASNYDGSSVSEETHKDKKAIIDKVSDYLASLSTSREEGGETDVITADKFIKEMSLTVLEEAEVTKEENEAVYNANNDDDDDNNVYNVALNFALVVVPDKENDDLVVKVLDGTGREIAAARIAGDGTADQYHNEIIDHGNGSYTLRDLQLAENSEMEFNLTLEGVQYLKQGVYIYNSEVRGNESSQTFVGMAEGHQEVDLRLAVDLKFDVKEGTVETKREWRAGDSFRYTPTGGGDPGESAEVDEEDVLLADAPKTGDPTLMLALVCLFSAGGLVGLNGKRKDEE